MTSQDTAGYGGTSGARPIVAVPCVAAMIAEKAET